MGRRLSKKLRLYLEFGDVNGQALWAAVQRTSLHQKWLVIEYIEQTSTQSTLSALVSMATVFNARATAHYHSDDTDAKHNIEDKMLSKTLSSEEDHEKLS